MNAWCTLQSFFKVAFLEERCTEYHTVFHLPFTNSKRENKAQSAHTCNSALTRRAAVESVQFVTFSTRHIFGYRRKVVGANLETRLPMFPLPRGLKSAKIEWSLERRGNGENMNFSNLLSCNVRSQVTLRYYRISQANNNTCNERINSNYEG